MQLLIATRNRHKLTEIRSLFHINGLTLVGADEFPGLPDVIEDKLTFEGNACKKAAELAAASGLWAMADDSGLEVDTLHGAPGVFSARYAGEPSNDEANNAKLLKELQGVTTREARFRCAVALSSPEGETMVVEGHCEGSIATQPRGTDGFGYDPLFVPRNQILTYAEMDADDKNRISHRGLALKRAHAAWLTLLTDLAATAGSSEG